MTPDELNLEQDRRAALLARLRELDSGDLDSGDPEASHMEADEALLDYINDDEISQAFRAIPKWYA